MSIREQFQSEFLWIQCGFLSAGSTIALMLFGVILPFKRGRDPAEIVPLFVVTNVGLWLILYVGIVLLIAVLNYLINRMFPPKKPKGPPDKKSRPKRKGKP